MSVYGPSMGSLTNPVDSDMAQNAASNQTLHFLL